MVINRSGRLPDRPVGIAALLHTDGPRRALFGTAVAAAALTAGAPGCNSAEARPVEAR
jgi:hypothetical protein